MYYLLGILRLSSNMCETDKKGLTELSEINLVRPFSSAFILRFLDSCNATGHIFLSDLAGFEFFCLFLPRMEHIEHGKVGGSLDLSSRRQSSPSISSM